MSGASFLGPCELDHFDAASPYTIRTGQLLGLVTRRLFAYRVPAGAGPPLPDVALQVPTVANGGVSEDGLTWRFRIRPGIFWDAQGARELVAADLVRGLKRVAHPTAAAARRYFTDTIAGMREYCETYDAVLGGWPANAPDFAQFHVAHEVAGLRAPDPRTLEIRLTAPANDLLHILATGVAAAAPREYDYYVPDSHELVRNAPSAGPYRIARRSRGHDLVLEPNPRWDPRTDPARRCLHQEIHVGPGAGRNGDRDVAWTLGTVSWAATATGRPLGYGVGPYLVVNLREPRQGRPISQPAVRRAIAAAVDRAAVRSAVAGAGVPGLTAVVQHTLLPPGSPGYEAGPEPRRGDPDRAGEILASTGLADRADVVLAVRDTEPDRRVAAVLRANLAACGIALEIHVRPGDRFADAVRAGRDWDLALTSWAPDWHGTNGRTAVAPLVRGGAEPGAANYGGYDNPVVDHLITEALQATEPAVAAHRWRLVDLAVMRDLPVIPLLAHACGPCTAAADAAPRLRWWPAPGGE